MATPIQRSEEQVSLRAPSPSTPEPPAPPAPPVPAAAQNPPSTALSPHTPTTPTPSPPAPATSQTHPSVALPAPISTISTSSAPLSSSTSTHASAGRISPPVTGVAPAAAPGPTSGPTTPSASPASNEVASSTPSKQNVSRTQPLTKIPIITKLWASRSLLFALVIVGLVDGLALSSSSAKSPLGSLSNTNGILVLSILATLTGYSLSAAAQTVWDRAPFRMFPKEQSSSLSLIVFWSLTSGVGGSCMILWRELCKLFHRESKSNTQKAKTQPHSHRRERGHPKIWSILRIASWIAMQFPGIIIMTIVNPETSYIPIQWTPISGGIGIYDPKEVAPDNALITSYVLSILQDSSRAAPIDPVNLECIQAGDSCKAFLIPGGLQAVSPWPYQKLADKTLDVYVTKGAPAYQLDFWSPPQNVTWPDDECSVYAASENESFQLCSSLNTDGKTIMAGWTPCIDILLPSGQCSQPGSWEAFNYTATYISISRRTATVYAMRDTSMIVAWEDLGKPEPQSITPSDFKTAFDVMVAPWSNSSSVLSPEDSTWQLTAQIASLLFVGLQGPETSQSLDYLHNFFATPLYVFNPVMLAFPALTNVASDLLPENYINGSYARTRVHAVPKRWTVLVYVIVSGILLLACFVGLILGTGYEGLELSAFPFIDSLKLELVVTNTGGSAVEDIREVFRSVDLADNKEVLERAARVGVKLRTALDHNV